MRMLRNVNADDQSEECRTLTCFTHSAGVLSLPIV